MPLNEYYEVQRSRNNGKFWSNVFNDFPLNYDEAIEMFETEHKKHPSDWLRLVKIEHTVEKICYGNAKSK